MLHSRVTKCYWTTAYERIADVILRSAALPRQGGCQVLPQLREHLRIGAMKRWEVSYDEEEAI